MAGDIHIVCVLRYKRPNRNPGWQISKSSPRNRNLYHFHLVLPRVVHMWRPPRIDDNPVATPCELNGRLCFGLYPGIFAFINPRNRDPCRIFCVVVQSSQKTVPNAPQENTMADPGQQRTRDEAHAMQSEHMERMQKQYPAADFKLGLRWWAPGTDFAFDVRVIRIICYFGSYTFY